MSSEVCALTTEGYNALLRVADDKPELFLESKIDEIKQELQEQIKNNAEKSAPLFSKRKWTSASSLEETIINNASSGPKKDAEHAKCFRQSFPVLTRSDMADERVLASLNCFHLSEYVAIRWQSSKDAKSEDKDTQKKFVKKHWLGVDKKANAVARIWWLYEYSHSSAEYSQYTPEVLLEKMANNVNFYHQMLDRPYLMASASIRAGILDVSISTGLADENKTGETNKLMRSLNRTAGGISLDILNREKLRELVEESLPPKEDAALNSQH